MLCMRSCPCVWVQKKSHRKTPISSTSIKLYHRFNAKYSFPFALWLSFSLSLTLIYALLLSFSLESHFPCHSVCSIHKISRAIIPTKNGRLIMYHILRMLNTNKLNHNFSYHGSCIHSSVALSSVNATWRWYCYWINHLNANNCDGNLTHHYLLFISRASPNILMTHAHTNTKR